MKRIGITLVLLGFAMFLGSCFLFVSVPIRAATANKAISVPLEIGTDLTTEPFTADTSKLCSVSVKVTVTSDKVHTRETLDHETQKKRKEHHLQYSFPFRYRVLDDAGNTIHTEDTTVSSNAGVRTGTGTVASADGGTATIEHHYAKFKVDEPGRIRLEATIQPDVEHGAKLESASVIVYDNVSKHSRSILTGVGLICFAPLMIVVGAIFTLVGLIRSSNSTTDELAPE